MSICAIPEALLDEQGYLPFDYIEMINDCEIPAYVRGFVTQQTIRDKHGHTLDGDFDPRGQGGCDHRDTPEWKAEHPLPQKRAPAKESPMPAEIAHAPTSAPTETSTEIVMYASNEATSATPAPAPATTTATVGVDSAVTQMKALLPAGADPALMVGGAVTLAVVGAAIKFGPSVLKARAERAEREHEEKMRRLEIEEKKAEKQDEQHQQCSASRMALEAKVASLESKLEALPKSGSSFDLGDFDPEELEDRLKKLEKALKPAPARGKKKG